MQLRRRQVELEAASREMGALEEQLGGLDVGNLEQERRSLVNQHNKLQEKVMDGLLGLGIGITCWGPFNCTIRLFSGNLTTT